MRDLLSKLTTGALVAGAALLVSACGGTEPASTVDNSAVTDLNAVEPAGEITDNMTAVDGTIGNEAVGTDAAAPAANEAVANDAAAQ
ncbi:hypothetical protein [Sphingomonas flavalba]|uniref:hypothetical protein n=1 Tax=Sphingomonas flavalba TaxID=2559804 RepID=UPI00109DF46E|nr:hypothetical protein [Sphingomonas flavalba]